MQQRHHMFRSHHIPKTAIVLSMSVFASAALGFGTSGIVQTHTTGSNPVDVTESTVAFEDGNDVLVEDPAIASQGDASGARTVKEFTQDTPFSMFALTWQGARDIAAFVRAQHEDGTWGPWYEAEPESEEQSATGINGTELIYVEPTRKVQVSTSGVDLLSPSDADTNKENAAPKTKAPHAPSGTKKTHDTESGKPSQKAKPTQKATKATPSQGAQSESAQRKDAKKKEGASAPDKTPASEAPVAVDYDDIAPVAEVTSAADINAVMIDGNAQEEIIPKAETITSGMPPVVSRASWGANESWRCSSPTINDHNSAVVIHHTAGSNNYSPAEAAAQVRGIYLYHAKTLGWCDVGYNALVDKWGTIYEGRAGGLDKNVQGAHAGGFNENTWGISMMGNYVSESPSPETIKAMGDMAGWRAAIDGFDPLGSADHISEGTSYTKYSKGTVVHLPNIFAHRDVGLTTCPGDAGYAKMDEIRAEAKKKYDQLMSSGGFSQKGESESEPEETASHAASTTLTPLPGISTAVVGTTAKGTAAKATPSAKEPSVKSTGTAAKGTAAKSTAAKGTAAKATPSAKSTGTKGTAAKSTAAKSASAKSTAAKAASSSTAKNAQKTTVREDKTEATAHPKASKAKQYEGTRSSTKSSTQSTEKDVAKETESASEPEAADATESATTTTAEPTAESDEAESTDPRTTHVTITLPTPTSLPTSEPTEQPTATTTVRVLTSEGVVPVEIESGSVVDQIITALQNNDEESLGDRINTLAGIVYKYLVNKGVLEEPLQITIEDIPVNPKLKALSENDANELAAAWKKNGGAAGELGQSRSGVQSAMTYDGKVINYAVFENGLIVNTEEIGTLILPQKIAEAWGNQGFDLGELGLPTSNPKYTGSTVTVTFQHGKVSYNTKTKKVSVTHK